MHAIMVLNTKGGCGKTTLATNLASYHVRQGHSVLLADFDPQGSSSEWLEVRPADRPPIYGVKAWKDPVRAPERPDYLVIDAPAGVHGRELIHLVRHAHHILVPVLPSPIDIRAAAHFIGELLLTRKAMGSTATLAVVANRAREQTLIYKDLERFLGSLEIPFIATLRETQNYIRAAKQGLGIFELPFAQVADDLVEWQPILNWLRAQDTAGLPRVEMLPADQGHVFRPEAVG
jgi:chromosome partitioning protein